MAEADKKDGDFVLHVRENPDEAIYFYKKVDAALQPHSRDMLLKYTATPEDRLVPHIKEVDLAFDGAPTDNMYGFDLEPEFFDIGYDFFRDRETFRGSFLKVDAGEDFSGTPLTDLVGKMDVIWCAKFIHLYDYDDQIAMASKLVRLLKPQPGSMFVGSQNGFPGGRQMKLSGAGSMGSKTNSTFLYDVDHLKQIWKQFSKRTGLEFDVEATLLDLRTIGRHKDNGSEYHKIIGYNLQYLITIK